jgi:hypothetical protein
MHWFMVVIGGSSGLRFGAVVRGRYGPVREMAFTHGMRLVQVTGGSRVVGRMYPPAGWKRPSWWWWPAP